MDDPSKYYIEIEPSKEFSDLIDRVRSWVDTENRVTHDRPHIGPFDIDTLNRPGIKEKSIACSRPAWLLIKRDIEKIFNFRLQSIAVLITQGGEQMTGYHHEGTQYLEYAHPAIERRFRQVRRHAALNFSLLTSESQTKSVVRWAKMPDYIEEENKRLMAELNRIPLAREEIIGNHGVIFSTTDTISSDPNAGEVLAEKVGMEKPIIFNTGVWHSASNLDCDPSSPRMILSITIDGKLLYEDIVRMYNEGTLYRKL